LFSTAATNSAFVLPVAILSSIDPDWSITKRTAVGLSRARLVGGNANDDKDLPLVAFPKGPAILDTAA
jgi:hypothetical protein